tara:strand:- start:13548 stop:13883 length:336 start_codon:yes stop_codon:yes gene_type:complete
MDRNWSIDSVTAGGKAGYRCSVVAGELVSLWINVWFFVRDTSIRLIEEWLINYFLSSAITNVSSSKREVMVPRPESAYWCEIKCQKKRMKKPVWIPYWLNNNRIPILGRGS